MSVGPWNGELLVEISTLEGDFVRFLGLLLVNGFEREVIPSDPHQDRT